MVPIKKIYTFVTNTYNVSGLTVNEITQDLNGNNYQSIDTSYYYYQSGLLYDNGYGLTQMYVARPHSVSTKNIQVNSSWGTAAVTEYNYDNWGNTTYIEDPNGNITYMAYANTDNNESNINLSQINLAYQNAKYQTGFPANCYNLLLTKATLVNDPVHNTNQLKQTHYQYDSQGNLLTESAVYGSSYLNISYTYDNYGNMLTKTDPNGNTLCFAYDSTYYVYLTKVFKPDNTTIATYSNFTDFGKPTTVTDPKGNTFSYTYDTIGRMTSETLVNSDPKLGITRNIAYNDAANSVNLSFGNNIAGNTLGWQYGQITYDPLFGKPKLIQRQLNGNWTTLKNITYDTAGRVATEADGMGHTTSYAYDALDRVTQTTYPDNTYSTVSMMIIQ